MYLKALELQGFKSFPDKTVLPFDEDITAVVGPNGSGKSNISDAIRWVVGEQSSKNLRGAKMEDVIFGGTEKRKQTGYAQVSLVMDNSHGIFPLEETEVMVTRKCYRSGDSEYFINKHSVRLKDVHELFMGTGLGKEGYALIGQGKIDEILSVKSSQRREVFEEAAGIAKYRHQKEDAERRLGRAEENLVRIEDKISELELQVKPLQAQSETAKKFLIFRDELRSLEISLWLEQLAGVQTDKIKIRADYDVAARERDGVSAEVDQLYAAVERFGAEMREKDVENEALRNTLAVKESGVSDQEAQITVLKNNISNNESNAQRLAESLEQKAKREGDLQAQAKAQEEKLAGLQLRRESLGQDSVEKQETAKILEAEFSKTTQELERLRREEGAETGAVSQAKSELSALASSTQEIFDQDENLRQEIGVLNQKMEEESRSQEAQEIQLKEAVTGRDEARNAVEGHGMRVEGRQNKLKALRDKAETLSRELHAMESKAKLLADMEQMYEGFSFAVKKVMEEAKRGGLQNIYGTVADLLTVPKDFTTAVEIALGFATQNIVVGDTRDTKAVSAFLRQQKVGRVTLLPLSTIQPGYLSQRDALSKEPGFVGIASDLVGYDSIYSTVVSNLLGRTVVMENEDFAQATAKKFSYKIRIVTLQGDLLNPGGSVAVGTDSKKVGILSRKEELGQLKEQIAGQGETLDGLRTEQKEMEASLSGDVYQLDLAKGELRRCEDAILQLESLCQGGARSLEGLKNQLGQRQMQMTQLKLRGEKIQSSTQEAQEKINLQEAKVQAVQVAYETQVQAQVRLQGEWQEAKDQATAVLSQLESLKVEEKAVEEGLETLRELLLDVTEERAENSTLIADYSKKNEEFDSEIRAMEEKIRENRSECERMRQEIETGHQEKLALEGKRNQADRDSREKNNHLLSLERSVTSLEQKKSTAEMEEAQILEKLWDTYELTHQGAKEQQIVIESVAKASRRIGELKRDISALGNINIDAIEEFEKINERYTYFTDQRDDITGAKKELQRIIAGIVKEMEDIFATEFGRINDAFGEIFVKLFGGGRAEVVLEDASDVLGSGIEIKAQPPGKALKTISLLSGGEKAFVAIALYFAILRIRPTPFVVMDEIEAALDDSNIERFVQYLRNICDKTQFIIITHRRGTMEAADVLYGITMQEKGVSRMLRLSLNEVEKTLNMTL